MEKRSKTLIILFFTSLQSINASICISEIHKGNGNLLEDEIISKDYIELYNTADTTVSLKGWKIETENSVIFNFDDRDKITPNTAILLSTIESKEIRNVYSNTYYIQNKDILRGRILLKDMSETQKDSVEVSSMSIEKGRSVHRTDIWSSYGEKEVKGQDFEEAAPTPWFVERITETNKSSVTITDENINNRHTVIMRFKKKVIENEENIQNEEYIENREIKLQKSDDKENIITVVPNPVINDLYINISNQEYKDCNYTLSTSLGKIVETGKINQQRTRIDMRKKAQGVYILTIDNNEQKHSFKIEKIK